MATRIRLRRMGATKRPFFRVVVTDQRSARDGRFIENIGRYHPLEDPSIVEIDEERALHWLRVGAQPSQSARKLLGIAGVWDTFAAERASVRRSAEVDARNVEAKRTKAARASGAAPRASGSGESTSA
jgi:small subunit ribosomal protein S16